MKFVSDDRKWSAGYKQPYPAIPQYMESTEEALHIFAFVQGIEDDKRLSTKLSCDTGHKRGHTSSTFEDQATFGFPVDYVVNQFDQIPASTIAEFAQKLGENGTHYSCGFRCAFVPEVAVKERDRFTILWCFPNCLDYGSTVEVVNLGIKGRTLTHVSTVFPAPATTSLSE